MKRKLDILRRNVYGLVALVLTSAIGITALTPAFVSAGQATTRFIELTNSAVSATGVTYTVSFKPTVTTNIGGIVVDFCADSPIIGSTTCTQPTVFDLGNAPSVSGLAGFSTSTGTWVTTNSLQGGAGAGKKQILLYTNTTAQTPTGTGTAISFDITAVTNTSTLGTFYARILTFDTSANTVSQYTGSGTTRAATFANSIDYGGVALSTANVLTITAKVQETLTFCVYVTGSDCAGGTGTAVALGDGNGVLFSTTTNYQASAKFGIATNAQTGAIVRLKGATLTSGANTITAQGSSCTADSSSAVVDQYGLRVTAGSGMAAVAPYNCGSGNHALDTSAGATGTGSTYGASIANTSSGPLVETQSTVEFNGKASTTSKAGIYTSNMTFIATGTY